MFLIVNDVNRRAGDEASRAEVAIYLGRRQSRLKSGKFTRSTHVSGLVIGYVQTRSFGWFAKNAGHTDAAVKREAGWSARVSVARSIAKRENKRNEEITRFCSPGDNRIHHWFAGRSGSGGWLREFTAG